MKTLFSYLLLSFFASTAQAAEPALIAQDFGQALGQVKGAAAMAMKNLNDAIGMDEQIKQMEAAVAAQQRRIGALQQQANNLGNAANNAAAAGQQQGAGQGGGGAGAGGGGGGGKGGPKMPETAKLEPAPPFELPQPTADVDVSALTGAMTPQPYQSTPSGPIEFAGGYNPKLLANTQPLSQDMSPGAIAREGIAGLKVQGGAKPGNPIQDGGAVAAAAAAANANANQNKPMNPGAPGMPGGGGADGSSLAGVGRGGYDEDNQKRPVASELAMGAASGEGGPAATSEGTGEEEIVSSKGPSLASAQPGKHEEKNPTPEGLMKWVGWVANTCASETGKTLVGVCANPVKVAAAGLKAFPAGGVAAAMDMVASSARTDSQPSEVPTVSSRAVASVPPSTKTESRAFVAPQQAGFGYRERAGLLGLVSGK